MRPLAEPATLCCLLAFTGPAAAAEWSAQPQFSLGGDVDTNRRLDPDDTTSQGARFTASVDLARNTARQKLMLRPRFAASRYDNEHDVLDSNDGGLELRLERFGERSGFNFNASGASDSTLTSEVTDTGIVQANARRLTLNGGLDYSVKAGERSRLQAGASYLDVDFDDAAGTGLTPYRYPSGFIAWSVDASERSQVSVSASGARLDLLTTPFPTYNYFARVTWNTRPSERLRMQFSGGVSLSESGVASEDGTLFGVSGAWSGDRTELDFEVSREVEPSALGYMARSDSASVACRWRLGERTTLSLQALYIDREELAFGAVPERREYSTLHAALGWRMTQQMHLELRAGGAYQAYELSGVSAHGERVALTFAWSPRRLARSR